MDPNSNPTPVAIPWYQSRIIWVQVVAAIFAAASFFGLDLGARIGMNEVQTVAVILGVIPVVTTLIRVVNPTPVVTTSKAKAANINAAAADSPSLFSGTALTDHGGE